MVVDWPAVFGRLSKEALVAVVDEIIYEHAGLAFLEWTKALGWCRAECALQPTSDGLTGSLVNCAVNASEVKRHTFQGASYVKSARPIPS